jgi:hypothetical protein
MSSLCPIFCAGFCAGLDVPWPCGFICAFCGLNTAAIFFFGASESSPPGVSVRAGEVPLPAPTSFFTIDACSSVMFEELFKFILCFSNISSISLLVSFPSSFARS